MNISEAKQVDTQTMKTNNRDNIKYKLRGETLDKFGVIVDGDTLKFEYSIQDNPFDDNSGVRKATKSFDKDNGYSMSGSVEGAGFFGWESALKEGGKKLIVCVNEMDALNMDAISKVHTKKEYQDYKAAIVSLPSGTLSELRRLYPLAKKFFSEVVLLADDNFVSQAAKYCKEIYTADMPAGSVSESRAKGMDKSLFENIQFHIRRPMPSCLTRLSSVIEDALLPVEYGKSYPWEGFTNLTYGQRKKEVVAIGGSAGGGKTTLVHEIAAWNAIVHNWNGLLVLLEETNAESLRNVAGKADSIPYHVPETQFNVEQFRTTAMKLDEHIMLWDNEKGFGDAVSQWEAIKDNIHENADWLDYVALDNVTCLTEGMDASVRNEFIAKIAKESAEMALRLDIEVFIVSHLNNPKTGTSHEEGGIVLESQFTGSRAIPRYSHVIVGFERNKSAKDPNCSLIRLLKHRKYGKSGIIKTYYNANTGRLKQFNWNDEDYVTVKIDTKKKEGKY